MRYLQWTFSRLIYAGFICLLSGCSAIQQTYGISATDLSWIKLGMTRTQIEAKLGSGKVQDIPNESGARVIYQFDRGYRPPPNDPPLWQPVAAVGWEAMNLISFGSRSYWERECQRSTLAVHYDADSLLIAVKEEMVDLGRIGQSGTRDICNRIRHNLIPSTLDVGKTSKPSE